MIKLPAGTYFVGDPCYIVPENDWIPLLEATDYFAAPATLRFRGYTVGASSTAYGDGTYHDQNGREYSVDAGLLGAVPVAYAKTDAYWDGGHVVEFPHPFTISYDDGVVVIGHIYINTDDDEYE